jgi:hypoxanthine phosphoribosyltransferase
MIKKEYTSYQKFGEMCDILVGRLKTDSRRFTCVYGPPRGAWPIVIHLSHNLDIPVLEHIAWGLDNIKDYILCVDDICDTGITLAEIKSRLDRAKKKAVFATLFYKQNQLFKPDYCVEETDRWICFPWERDDEKPNPYHQGIYPDIEFVKDPDPWIDFDGSNSIE